MSRHRDIRNMDYTDDYEGYDDIYGHSVDDDYYISPSNRQYIYNRENSKEPGKTGDSNHGEKDIQEEDETVELIANLSDMDKAKLMSCLEQITATLGPTNISRNEMEKAALAHDFDVERTLNAVLDHSHGDAAGTERKDKVINQSSTTATTTILPIESDFPMVKVVAAGAGSKSTTNITRGFDLSQKDLINRLNTTATTTTTPRSQSPASGRGTPINSLSQNVASDFYLTDDLKSVSSSSSKMKDINSSKGVDANAQYRKDRGDGKEHIYMVVIGHVDAGKSTLMGHLLCALGQVTQRTMHKYEQESRKLGKQSFMYAWVLDETGEERNRGITMDIARHQFETETKCVTLLDAPGHKDFIPNMIAGTGQADVALLVVDATRGEFETGFDYGGQTREHALLARSLGVTQLAVAVNKLDTVSWSQDRFEEIVQKLKVFLKQAGFRDADVTFVPCSGLTGQNLIGEPTENELITWYNGGPCLLKVIDNFRSPERPVSKPFRLSVNDIFKGTGSGFCVSGRVETGILSVGDRILICPNKEAAVVKSIFIEELSQTTVYAGDQATVTLSGVEMQNVSVGNILCDSHNPVQVASKFQARIVVFNVTVPITKGFSVILHHQSLVEPVIVSKLVSQLNRSTGELIKKHPRFLGNNTSAIVEVQVLRPIALELYSDCKELGRIMLRVGGVTIAAGLITKIVF